MLKPNVILPEKTWTQRPLIYDYLKLTEDLKLKNRDPNMEKGSSWKRPKNAKPWGQADEVDDNDQKMQEKEEMQKPRGCQYHMNFEKPKEDE